LLKYLDTYLGTLGTYTIFFIACIGVLLLGAVDGHIASEISFSVFYTAPIMLATWYGGKKVGYSIAIISAGTWLYADFIAGSQYSSLLIPVWNMLVRLVFFLIILRLLLGFREKLALEESLAATDPLTGLSNRRFFHEQLEREYARNQRHSEPFTIVYLDLDNFKHVNDTMGHAVGDVLLQNVAQTLLTEVRSSDFVSRLGGDEFAILFPMLDKSSTSFVLEKLQSKLLETMRKKNWPVTFSIGAVTFSDVMDSSQEMVKLVDDLMYEVKKSGKNDIRHVYWPEGRPLK
jgi:diguanylate cyclase (GGDEF)-like protein